MPKGSRSSKKPKLSHPSVAALIELNDGHGDPKEIIRALARAKVSYAKGLGWEGPPFCPKILCSLVGIRCFEVNHDIGGDGRILRGPDGRPRIEYVSGRMSERQRFTLFHEFAHTLFPDYCDFLPLYHEGIEALSPEEKEFEKLCDIAASEMLFPTEDVIGDIEAFDRINFERLYDLSRRYHASIDATCYKVAEITNNTALSFAFLTDLKGNFPGGGPLWVRHSSPSKLFKGYVLPGTSPPRSSVALHCFYEGSPTTELAKETWWIHGSPRTYLVQAASLPPVDNPDYPKVVALLLPQGYKGGAGYSPRANAGF
jgi:Zn-dependent peptidase ImmA (M78 family)